MQLQIDADLTAIAEPLAQQAHNLTDLSGLMAQIGAFVRQSTKERIASGKQSLDGVSWANLAPSTIAAKGHDEILIDTHELWDSILYQASDDMVVIGSSIAYGSYLQTGTRKMPARPWLGLSADDMAEIGQLVANYLEQ